MLVCCQQWQNLGRLGLGPLAGPHAPEGERLDAQRAAAQRVACVRRRQRPHLLLRLQAVHRRLRACQRAAERHSTAQHSRLQCGPQPTPPACNNSTHVCPCARQPCVHRWRVAGVPPGAASPAPCPCRRWCFWLPKNFRCRTTTSGPIFGPTWSGVSPPADSTAAKYFPLAATASTRACMPWPSARGTKRICVGVPGAAGPCVRVHACVCMCVGGPWGGRAAGRAMVVGMPAAQREHPSQLVPGNNPEAWMCPPHARRIWWGAVCCPACAVQSTHTNSLPCPVQVALQLAVAPHVGA